MSGRAVGVVILVVVAIVMLVLIQSNQSIQPQQLIKDITQYAGTTIETYKTPEFLNDEQRLLMEKYALENFFSDELPAPYQQLAQQQTVQTNSSTNGTQTNTTETKPQPLVVSPEGSNQIYKYGDEILIAGKITRENRPAPYLYNVIITCCGMTSFKAKSSVETDGQGNFAFFVRPDTKYPIGNWVVTISTIGDDNKIVKHDFPFTLIAGY